MDILVACKVQWHLKGMLWEYFFRVYEIDEFISENFRKLYDADWPMTSTVTFRLKP